MKKKKSTLFNNWFIGVISGLVIPIPGVYIFYLTQDVSYDFSQFLNLAIKYNLFSQILSVGVIANLLIFFLFLNTNNYKSAKGVILATFIYAIITLIIKYLI